MNYKRFHSNLIHLSATDSTNNYAANLVKETNVVNGTAVLTKRQDFGRGQRGNSWETEPDKNLIASVIIFPELNVQHIFYLTVAVSLAVEKTLSDLGLSARIKWPNDLYVNNSKICGILIENQIQGKKIANSIAGIGLNVNQTAFSKGLNATSILMETGNELEVKDVFLQFYGYLDFYCDHLMQSGFKFLLDRYYSRLFQFGEKALYEDKDGTYEGVISGVDNTGRLKIKKEDNSMKVYDLKEVRYII